MVHMDGVALYAMTRELFLSLAGGRIERIAQIGALDLLFTIRANNKNRRLFLSTNPEAVRLYLTEETAEADQNQRNGSPSSFLMLLRKHVGKGRVRDISMPSLDRVVIFTIEAADDLGDLTTYWLIFEVMGKHSNLILTDASGRIIDSIKRVYDDMSSIRTVLPGVSYQTPPPQEEKKNPLELGIADFTALFSIPMPFTSILSQHCLGLSPHTARMLSVLCDSTGDVPLASGQEEIAKKIATFFHNLKEGILSPSLLYQSDTPFCVFCCPLPGYETQAYPTLSTAYAEYYRYHLRLRQVETKKNTLFSSIKEGLARLHRRLSIQNDVLLSSRNFEEEQHKGALLLAYAHTIPRGTSTATVTDYLTGEDLILVLDPTLSPHQNAEKHFQRSRRQKAALKAAEAQKAEILPQIEHLESVRQSIEMASHLEDLSDIQEELQAEGYLRRQKTPQKQGKQQSQPVRFLSSDGIEILAGRNNRQNDLLTTKIARSTDLWFHVQGMPGSHVIARGQFPLPHDTMVAALHIAAHYSRGRKGENIPIDVTQIKHVRKPAGSKPGYVVYTQQKTYFITPDEQLIKKLILDREN